MATITLAARSAAPRRAARPVAPPRPPVTLVERSTGRSTSADLLTPEAIRAIAAQPGPVRQNPVRPNPVRQNPVRPHRSPVRLTRRGRRLARTLVVALALLVALLVSVAGRSAQSEAGNGAARPATTTVVVQPGETLWQVARSVSADADVRETVARIQELNGLAGADTGGLRPGQQLIVPVVA